MIIIINELFIIFCYKICNIVQLLLQVQEHKWRKQKKQKIEQKRMLNKE